MCSWRNRRLGARCSADDRNAAAQPAFLWALADCGSAGLTWHGWSSEPYMACLEKKSPISRDCASCYEAQALYALGHCKLVCGPWKGNYAWCSSSCLACMTSAPSLEPCTGGKVTAVAAGECEPGQPYARDAVHFGF